MMILVMPPSNWTRDMHDWCSENRGLKRKDLQARFIEKYSIDPGYENLKAFMSRNGYLARPRRLQVGTERVLKRSDKNSQYTKIKVAEPNVWALKHVHVWENENGSVPEGHALLFYDGDQSNCDVENLVLLKRREILFLNRSYDWSNIPDEYRKTAILLAKTKEKIASYERKGKSKDEIKTMAAKHGIPYKTVMCRMSRNGWSLNKAVNTPLRKCKQASDRIAKAKYSYD